MKAPRHRPQLKVFVIMSLELEVAKQAAREAGRVIIHHSSMINTDEALMSLVDRSLQAEVVALDTEFFWERTYRPQLGVIQLGLSEEECFLIDVLAIPDLTPLGRLLASPSVVKILHDAQQDLTILHHATGAFPKNIFDTRRAAGFAGMISTISLQDLLSDMLGIALAKDETRSNWLRRPLSSKQMKYALDDVHYLGALRDELLARTQARGFSTWLEEDLAAYDDPTLYQDNDARERYHRVKGWGRLNARELAVLRELTAWREHEAGRQDRPRGHVLQDQALVELAQLQPRSTAGFKRMDSYFEHQIRRCQDAIVQVVATGLAVTDEDCPRPSERPSGLRQIRAQVDAALIHMREKAEEIDLDPALVGSRAEFTSLIAKGAEAKAEHHRLLRGWRREFIGEELLKSMQGETVDSISF